MGLARTAPPLTAPPPRSGRAADDDDDGRRLAHPPLDTTPLACPLHSHPHMAIGIASLRAPFFCARVARFTSETRSKTLRSLRPLFRGLAARGACESACPVTVPTLSRHRYRKGAFVRI